jgi:endonuclease YncB( thermonuclease family)
MQRLLMLACAALALQACFRKPEPPPESQAPALIKAKVTVLNADVLVIDGKHYALANGFAPQPVPDARCWAEATAAKQATRTVAAMVERAGSVEATPTGAKDSYNRDLATIRLDGADLGDVLFKEGLAARPTKGRFEWCDPISRRGEGAPDVFSMMEMTPGPAPAH